MKTREPQIHPTAQLGPDVEIGDWSVIHANVIIQGKVKIGREAWINPYAEIGGGRRELGSLQTGDFLHMGKYSFINIADRVTLGHEVGLGMWTALYTHGGYLDEARGFPNQRGPITIGNEVWLPKAIVLPNVTIGNHVVIAAESLVNKDIPSGCLAGGIPAHIIEREKYPIRTILDWNGALVDDRFLGIGDTEFDLLAKRIEGPVTEETERFKDSLRRRGIRFRYYDKGGIYAPWD